MPVDSVAKLVRGLSQDEAAILTLRYDPMRLASEFGLTAVALSALGSADQFFKTEKPITQSALNTPRKAEARVRVASPPQPVLAQQTLVASSDTGTLLPGPNTGTLVESGETTCTSVVSPGPAVPSPSPVPAPGPAVPSPSPVPVPSPTAPPLQPAPWSPPTQPSPVPSIPRPPTTAPWPTPVTPSPWPIPQPPSDRPTATPQASQPCPPPPSSQPYPPPMLAYFPAIGGTNCDCQVSVMAITAMVNTTAQTALAAITALAKRGVA